MMDILPEGLDPIAWRRHALLSVAEMKRADQAAIAAGVPGYNLMRAAGKAVADAAMALGPGTPGTAAVLCGPGNNGGDGFVAARLLAAAGWTVKLGLLGSRDALGGDAAMAAADWAGRVETLAESLLDDADIAVDAIFGAGLNRAPDGDAAAALAALNAKAIPVVAVDLPSGLSGDSGRMLDGALARADRTVAFFRGKPGHWLLPGRVHCGEMALADIGIPERVLGEIAPRQALNHPDLWRAVLPSVSPFSHKYSRGHVLIAGGAELIGAACLAARSAMRGGAGIVTVAAPVQQGPLYRLALESAVVRSVKDTRAFIDLFGDARIDAAVVGPGLGLLAPGNHEKIFAALRSSAVVVLDADALTLFADAPDALFDAIQGPTVLTPHDGEFRRLFPDLADNADKLARARAASDRSGAVMLLKGYDTVVAAPDGTAVINASAPETLATAGAGDVLCGLIAALAAGGMPVFAAAAAAVYMHGAAAARFGPGLIASDLPALIPSAIDRAKHDT